MDPYAEGRRPLLRTSPNKHMQRAGTHKVLGRGRGRLGLSQVGLARVLMGQSAGADVGRYAALPSAHARGRDS